MNITCENQAYEAISEALVVYIQTTHGNSAL
ncbi:hypothetical protein SAMN02745664_11842 [Moraxella cuniculi DSM 21768]|uniref:Uncharacterized protein n=2 Tax=Moraxella cuniculi TaxID=34061 RepID=A0A1N7FWZ3_9GAMM|nr:hypothetical protein SAMN02745664_11842 [Moraxella cuniculi DSM 21768]VEG13896.1 Uncharacterised protein [Moraxella cuniculi]